MPLGCLHLWSLTQKNSHSYQPFANNLQEVADAIMPVCAAPGCPNLVQSGRCETCRRPKTRDLSAAWNSWYSERRWRAVRVAFLRKNRLCIDCQADGHIEPATIVDHEPPHHGNRQAFWESSRFRALCKRHHDRKTATQNRPSKN
jgi:5-methylcytosine-specific restriction protein A